MFIIVCRRNMEAVVDFLMRDDKHKILFFWVSIIKHEASVPAPRRLFVFIIVIIIMKYFLIG